MPAGSRERIGQLLKTALQVLADSDGQGMRVRDILPEVAKRVTLTDHERQRHEKSGYVRWESTIHFYSIDCVKAGWLVKNDGRWYLTEEGRKALALAPLDFLAEAQAQYKRWRQEQSLDPTKPTGPTPGDQEPEEAEITRQTALEQAIGEARAEMEAYIAGLGPYDFQYLVAALLRGMGYHTPFIAPQGPDGGIDIIAYRDPLGSSGPRIKAQVKHRADKVSVREVRELASLLNKDGDVGLIVSSGGFTSEALAEIRRAIRHIEKIDLTDLLRLWEQHYDQMREEDRLRLPIRRVAFLAPRE